jgi:hypothetical protein
MTTCQWKFGQAEINELQFTQVDRHNYPVKQRKYTSGRKKERGDSRNWLVDRLVSHSSNASVSIAAQITQ